MTSFFVYYLGTRRLKMYCDENGTFKGEVLVTYLFADAAKLAVELLNDTSYNPDGILRKDAPKISVSFVCSTIS